MASALGIFGPIGTQELIILGVVGLVIFGRRLPEVGRSLGRGIVEFKQGLSGVEEKVNDAGKTSASASEGETASAASAEESDDGERTAASGAQASQPTS